MNHRQHEYLMAVKAAGGPYSQRHGGTAAWAQRHGFTEWVVMLTDGTTSRLSAVGDRSFGEFLGCVLTPLGEAYVTVPGATRLTPTEVERALMEVVDAVRDYLPPDGIGAQECLARVIAATDNPEINPIIAQIEARR